MTQTTEVNVYNTDDLSINTTFSLPSGVARDMHFDTASNVHIAGLSPEIHVYDKNYEFVRTITYPGAEKIDGWVFQCDGGKILADQKGKVVFVDKHDNVQQIHTGYGSPRNIAITKSRALFVIDFQQDKLFVY